MKDECIGIDIIYGEEVKEQPDFLKSTLFTQRSIDNVRGEKGYSYVTFSNPSEGCLNHLVKFKIMASPLTG